MNQGKRLVRSKTNRVIAGVCGGVAEYLDIDATIVRILTVVLPGIGWVTYLICAIIMPAD